MPTNLEIAQAATLRPIQEIAAELGLAENEFEALGKARAKLTWQGIHRAQAMGRGKLILVTAITPTPAGEGKTTCTIGLTQALRKRGVRAISATREPALGPVFGVKGGAAGGGYSQVLPMEEINLFFNGDFPAITAAHGLLSAMLDACLYHGNSARLDPRYPMWPRAVDANDRALRNIVVGLGGRKNGVPREDGFVITPASEVMAVLGMSTSIADLKARLGRMLVGYTTQREPVHAEALECIGAMAALLRDALRPNLVQTMEGGPAFVHGGPFANIAHGTSSVIATQCALGLGDYVVTEAGFAADLGAEKFMHLVSPVLGQRPEGVVLVATVRALKHHGDGDLELGLANLRRHLTHLKMYGAPVLVAVNRFADDRPEELAKVVQSAQSLGAQAAVADAWGAGGEGCLELADLVMGLRAAGSGTLYELTDPLETKIEKIARGAYGADGVEFEHAAKDTAHWLRKHGLGDLPVCMAKTQSSLSDDPQLKNAPTGFTITVRDLKPSLGAGFVVALAGEMLLMPGLGKAPAAKSIDVDDDGQITGLF